MSGDSNRGRVRAIRFVANWLLSSAFVFVLAFSAFAMLHRYA